MFELVKGLTKIFGTAGNESEVADYIKKEIENYVDEISIDNLGNLVAIKKGSGKKIMLASHMDEIGIIATYIEENGFIRFSKVGGISQFYSLGQRVQFKNGIKGTVFYEEKTKSLKELEISKMYIDIGAKTKKEAEDKIQIGDTAVFVGECYMQGSRIVSKALDDRAGCAVLIDVIKNLKNIDNEIYFVFTVQEELGLRGAKASAYNIKPDIALAVDVTRTGDTPKSKNMKIELGKGAAIKIMDNGIITHPVVKNKLIEISKDKNISYQLEVLEHGSTDAGAIHVSSGGVPTGAVSIPCRYIHSPVEMIDIDDMNNASKLIQEFVNTDFK